MADISRPKSEWLSLLNFLMAEACGGVNRECGNGDGDPSVSIENTMSTLIFGSRLAMVFVIEY